MRWIKSCVVAAMVMGTTTGAWAVDKGVTLQDRQQAACYDDVQRLCSEFVPDVTKTEACMKSKRSQVSKKCSDMYDVKK